MITRRHPIAASAAVMAVLLFSAFMWIAATAPLGTSCAEVTASSSGAPGNVVAVGQRPDC